MDDAATSTLFGLGNVTQGRLAEVGISTVGALRATGSVEAYRRLKFMFPRQVTLTALYALEAALRGCHWNDLPPSVKTVLRREATAIDEALRGGLSPRCRRN